MNNNYWWSNTLTKFRIKGKIILKFTGEGCQSCDSFDWVGKVVDFETDSIVGDRERCEYVVIEIIKHNHSYNDNRDKKEPEIYRYPLVNADIQNVNGVWILFT